ncbi:SIR2 family protein [Bacteroidota bacterium]
MKKNLNEVLVTNVSTFNKYKDRIQKAKNNKSLAFILGGGVSAEFKIPLWNDLIAHLLTEHLSKQKSHLNKNKLELLEFSRNFIKSRNINLTILARFLRKQYNKENWFKVVHKSIYSSLDKIKYKDEIKSSRSALGYLTKLAKENSNLIFLTYNFDSLLEEFFEARKIYGSKDYRSYHEPRGRIIPYKINIFHIHGYLPHSKNAPELFSTSSKQLVLCEDDYHISAISPTTWQNSIPLSVLLTRTCIFVGTSLTDSNQRRLLDTYKTIVEVKELEKTGKGIPGLRFHYALLRHPNYERKIPVKETQLDRLATKEYANIQEKILKDLRVYPIWYKEHEDIPFILNKIFN